MSTKLHDINFLNILNDINFLSFFKKFFWDFDAKYYQSLYSDLKDLNTVDLMKHYINIGRFEKRLYNEAIKILIVCESWNDNAEFTSGGNKALYNLGKLINDKKKKYLYAKMYVFERKNVSNPFCNKFAYDNEINSRTLVIYPDGNYDNPLKAQHVMRWILLEVGTKYRPISIVNTWDKNDIVYHWELSKISKNNNILNTTVVDDIYINKYYNRTDQTCYLIKKRLFYNENLKYIHPNNSICIDKMDKINIIELFNTCKYFYCYDLYTFFVIGAIICGCKVIIVPFDNTSKQEYINYSIFNKFEKIEKFFAWGVNDVGNINYNDYDVKELKEYINSLSNSVDIFLDNIYKYFTKQPTNLSFVKNVYF